MASEVFDACREDWRPHRVRVPLEEELGRWSTYSSPARSHATCGLQFGRAQTHMILETRMRDIFAPPAMQIPNTPRS